MTKAVASPPPPQGPEPGKQTWLDSSLTEAKGPGERPSSLAPAGQRGRRPWATGARASSKGQVGPEADLCIKGKPTAFWERRERTLRSQVRPERDLWLKWRRAGQAAPWREAFLPETGPEVHAECASGGFAETAEEMRGRVSR